jgi:hypothetical protein
MMKLMACAIVVLLGMTGVDRLALAQVPGGGGEAVCQQVTGGIVSDQFGGTFPVGPASCDLLGFSTADIAISPIVLLTASVDAGPLDAGDRNAAAAVAALQYDFILTGGHVGDVVPIGMATNMHTSVDHSDDPNNANAASANVDVFFVSSPGGPIIGNGPGVFACSVSPGPADPDEPPECPSSDSNDDVLSFDMVSGATGRLFLQVLVAASANSHGTAEADADPFLFVDPRFPNAADYTITVLDGVANAAPAVPEPGTWALLLAGLGGLGLARRRNVRAARPASRAGLRHLLSTVDGHRST